MLRELSEPPPIASVLTRRWSNPQSLLHPVLGKPTYRLPDITGYRWHAVDEDGRNYVLASPDGDRWRENQLHFGDRAKDNVIIFGPSCACLGRYYVVGSNNLAIVLGAPSWHQAVNVHFHSDDHLFYFGEDCTSNTTTFEMGGEPSSIIVGRDCMFSAGIDVMTFDAHAIIGLSDGAYLNPSRSVLFEPHVWIGYQALVLKGARIGFGSIVGARAVVTRDIPEKSLAVGNPAKVVRGNVSWARDPIPPKGTVEYLQDMEKLLF